MDWFNKKKVIPEKESSKPVNCGVCREEESLKLRFMQDYTRYKSLLDQIEVGKPFYIDGCLEEFILEEKPVLTWETFYNIVREQALQFLSRYTFYDATEMVVSVWSRISNFPNWSPDLAIMGLADGLKRGIGLASVKQVYKNFIDVVPERIQSIEAIEKNGYRGIQWVWVKVLISKGFYTQEEVDAVSRKLCAWECKKLMLGQQFDGDGFYIQKVLNGYVHFTQGGNAVMVISDEEMDRLAG